MAVAFFLSTLRSLARSGAGRALLLGVPSPPADLPFAGLDDEAPVPAGAEAFGAAGPLIAPIAGSPTMRRTDAQTHKCCGERRRSVLRCFGTRRRAGRLRVGGFWRQCRAALLEVGVGLGQLIRLAQVLGRHRVLLGCRLFDLLGNALFAQPVDAGGQRHASWVSLGRARLREVE